MSSESKTKKCPTCGAKTVEYRHNLSKPLLRALVELFNAGGEGNPNLLALTHNQKANFQKLRYWEVVGRVKNPDGSNKGGFWKMTNFGKDFVKGKVRLPRYVWTYRGNRIRFEGDEVEIWDLLDGYKYRPEYAAEAQGVLL